MQILKLTIALCCVYLVLTLELFPESPGTGSRHGKVIVCYVGTYASTRPGIGAFHIHDIDPSLCTHIVFSFVGLKNDSSLFILDSWSEFIGDNNNILEMKSKYPQVNLLVGLGGWVSGTQIFSSISQDPEKRKILARNVANFVRENGFHGLDVCWLYPTKRSGFLSDRIHFVELLKEIKTQLQSSKFLLTALIGGSYDTIDSGYDVKNITKIVDFMNMLTYDYNGFWSEKIAPNAPMQSSDKWNVEFTINHMLKLGADREKLVLGVTTHGRIFFASQETFKSKQSLTIGDNFDKESERAKNYTGPYTQDENGVLSYFEICLETLNGRKWTRYWDEASSTPFIVHEDMLITYDDIQSVAVKVKYALIQGLAGVNVFSLDLDDFRGICTEGIDNSSSYPLLRTINEEIKHFLKGENIFKAGDDYTSHELKNYVSNLATNKILVSLVSLIILVY